MPLRQTKNKPPKVAKGFSGPLGAVDDALAAFWFSVPTGHAGHCRLSESERKMLIEHLEAAGLGIVPLKRPTKKMLDAVCHKYATEPFSHTTGPAIYVEMIAARPKWGETQ